jgi:DNA-binding HxlR family transcriptional regulator
MAKVDPVRSKALQSRDAVQLLSNKWRITILHILRSGPLRTGVIQKAITEVSPKVLTQTLRGMERDGLLFRDVLSVAPLRIEYRLTPMGASLVEPLRHLCLWAKAHIEERDRSRARFDQAEVAGSDPLEPETTHP